jgi:hypothetical protein
MGNRVPKNERSILEKALNPFEITRLSGGTQIG